MILNSLLILPLACGLSASKGSNIKDARDTNGTQRSTKAISTENEKTNCKEDINTLVTQKSGHVKYCYDVILKDQPNIRGRVVVDFSLQKDGYLSTVDIPVNTTQSDTLGDCIERKISSWQFPKDCETESRLSFVLAPGEMQN